MSSGRRNIRLIVEYDGTAYAGWQIQENAVTVQGKLEEALRIITGETIRVAGASRTDSGVHALGQVCNFYTESRIPVDRFPYALNANLPGDIVVAGADSVPDRFHSRIHATGKLYRYRILNRTFPSPLWRNFIWHIREPLDLPAMEQATRYLEGEHDFASFQAAGSSVVSTVRHLERLSLCRNEDGMIEIEAAGNGFLYHMVRIIVGTLVLVGRGRLAPDEVQTILALCDRTVAGPTAPAQGLVLEQVYYPEELASLDSRECLG